MESELLAALKEDRHRPKKRVNYRCNVECITVRQTNSNIERPLNYTRSLTNLILSKDKLLKKGFRHVWMTTSYLRHRNSLQAADKYIDALPHCVFF